MRQAALRCDLVAEAKDREALSIYCSETAQMREGMHAWGTAVELESARRGERASTPASQLKAAPAPPFWMKIWSSSLRTS